MQRKQLPFAVSLAINKTLPMARQILHDEWQRQLGEDGRLRKTFPRQVLRWTRATKQHLVGVLDAIGSTGKDVIRLQSEGGTKTAKGRALRIPASDAPKRSSKTPYRAGQYLFAPRKRGSDKYVGKLQKSVQIPRKFDFRPVLAKIRRVFAVELEQAIRKALRSAR